MNANEIVKSHVERNSRFQAREKLSGWDKAIADAKKGIERLRAALGHAEAMKAAKEPWPGDMAA